MFSLKLELSKNSLHLRVNQWAELFISPSDGLLLDWDFGGVKAYALSG